MNWRTRCDNSRVFFGVGVDELSDVFRGYHACPDNVVRTHAFQLREQRVVSGWSTLAHDEENV